MNGVVAYQFSPDRLIPSTTDYNTFVAGTQKEQRLDTLTGPHVCVIICPCQDPYMVDRRQGGRLRLRLISRVSGRTPMLMSGSRCGGGIRSTHGRKIRGAPCRIHRGGQGSSNAIVCLNMSGFSPILSRASGSVVVLQPHRQIVSTQTRAVQDRTAVHPSPPEGLYGTPSY